MKKILYILVPLLIVIVVLSILLLNKNNGETQKEEKKISKQEVTTTKKQKEEEIMDGITLNYHASIRIEKKGSIIYFDPYKITNTDNDANYIFITHSHYDHYSEADIKKVMNENTKFIVTSDLEDKVQNLGVDTQKITVVFPNKEYKVDNISFETIPSYNINKTFHKKSYNWVGYNINLDNNNYYIVGDSDVTDELKSVKCDVIFIPVGGTYTMTDEQAASVVNDMDVKYAVPIHYGEVGSHNNAENFINKLNKNIKGVILK